MALTLVPPGFSTQQAQLLFLRTHLRSSRHLRARAQRPKLVGADFWNRAFQTVMKDLSGPRADAHGPQTDALISLFLAESVYRALDPGGVHEASRTASQTYRLMSGTPLKLQWSLPDVEHRHMVAASADALYIAFMGTKQQRDILANARVGMTPPWQDASHSRVQSIPSVHRGFLQRARSINIAALQKHARMHGLRLVLCGHSLGGAVAQLCTLDLLHSLPEEEAADVACISFAAPAIGNAALAHFVERHGWQAHFSNYLLPEDVIGTFFGRHVPATDAVADECKALGQSLRLSGAAAEATECVTPATEQVQRNVLASNVVPFPIAAHSEHAALPLAIADAWVVSSTAARACQVAASPCAAASLTSTLPGSKLWRPSALQASTWHSNRQLSASMHLGGRFNLQTHAAAASLASDGATSSGAAALARETPVLQRQSTDSQWSCTGSASLSTATSCSSFDDDGEQHPDNEMRSVLRTVLSKAASIAVLPALLGAYVSIGQQRSLRLPQDGQHKSGASSSPAGERRQRSGSIFWMHRLPVYRERMLALSEKSLQRSVADLAADGPALTHISDDVAPAMHITSATVMTLDAPAATAPGAANKSTSAAWIAGARGGVASLLSGYSLPSAAALHGLLLSLLLRARLFLGSLRSAAFGQGTQRLLIAVHGKGLDMCSAAYIHMPGMRPQPATLVRFPCDMDAAMAAHCGVTSAVGRLDGADESMVLSAEVPRRAFMHLAKVPSGSYQRGPYVRLRSDYQTVTLPLAVMALDVA